MFYSITFAPAIERDVCVVLRCWLMILKKYFRNICRIKNSYYLCTRNQGNEIAKKERVL